MAIARFSPSGVGIDGHNIHLEFFIEFPVPGDARPSPVGSEPQQPIRHLGHVGSGHQGTAGFRPKAVQRGRELADGGKIRIQRHLPSLAQPASQFPASAFLRTLLPTGLAAQPFAHLARADAVVAPEHGARNG